VATAAVAATLPTSRSPEIERAGVVVEEIVAAVAAVEMTARAVRAGAPDRVVELATAVTPVRAIPETSSIAAET